MFPAKIKVVEQSSLFLKWNDNSESMISLSKLRKFCPCASCEAERSIQSNSYIPLYHSGQIRINKLNMVGNYAIGITWEDGHNTGIYEFKFLKNLAEN